MPTTDPKEAMPSRGGSYVRTDDGLEQQEGTEQLGGRVKQATPAAPAAPADVETEE